MSPIKKPFLACCCGLVVALFTGCTSSPSASTEKTPLQVGQTEYGGRIVPVFDGLTVKSEMTTPPVYPADLRRAGLEGVGTVMIIVDETGHAVEFGIVNSTPDSRFGLATLAAAKTWRYFPMTNEAGSPIVHALRMRITYALDKDQIKLPAIR